MEPTSEHQRNNKRKIFEDEDAGDKVYRFKVLLPNGTSIGLTLRNPEPQMPFKDFICLVKEEYIRAQRHSESVSQKKHIKWSSEALYVEDANDKKLKDKITFKNFKPLKCHILRLHEKFSKSAETFENMWDLTPDTDLLAELPEEYTFETALADLMDNSLQAVWSNDRDQRKLVSVDIIEGLISVFDTGPGMDGSNENSIVKWGKMGASIHRSSKVQAIGGKPPYLLPYFGMFGYGGPIASMHLGRRALVSSKTKESNKVFSLHLVREALLSSSGSEHSWRTDGGIRNPSEDEIEKSPHGSFTKVEIYDPKMKNMDILHLQCKLKDIYFPYIQCDELSNTGKTMTPIEFQVNGVDLAEIDGGEVARTNLHSCNGPDFVIQLCFLCNQKNAATKSPGLTASREANARLKFVYFPIVEGKESIEMILENLEAEGYGIGENYDTFSRVSVRRLGRLLPEARWACLPLMEPKQKRKDNAQLLKRCCLRVKCFIDTDAGFNPTPCKTDLAHHNPFSTALKNFGNKPLDKGQEINIEIYKDGKPLSPLQLEREYQEWILQMHHKYDTEINIGEDHPVHVVSPKNKKELGISSDVVRVHRALKRKGASWKHGQKIKILKGAYAGFHKNNVYATLEYFLVEGFEGDAGGDVRIICRPLGLPDENGCTLAVNDGNACIDLHNSLSLPIGVLDSGKCLAVESTEWDYQFAKKRQRMPSKIELLSVELCQELAFDEALPVDSPVHAGYIPPKEIVAVVRPASFTSSTALNNLDQKYIVNINLEMHLEVKFRGETEDSEDVNHIYSTRLAPSSHKGFHGLYIFPLRLQFQKAGVYTFTFSLQETTCKNLVTKLLVKSSCEVGKWDVLDRKSSYTVRVGSCFPPFSVTCYDIHGNRIPFTSIPEVLAELRIGKVAPVHIDQLNTNISSNNMTLEVKDLVIVSNDLDKIRPSYKANLVILSRDQLNSVSIPCQVTPGSLRHVMALPPVQEKHLLPGFTISDLVLEMFDEFRNHVTQNLEVDLIVDGFCIQDQTGPKRKVDKQGRIDLSGILTVTGGYGSNVSLSILLDNRVYFKQEFQIEKRELQLASRIPEHCTAGSQLEHVAFQIVNSEGVVDETIHDNEKSGYSHMLTIKSEFFNRDNSIRYAFRHGRCTVPLISLPQSPGTFSFIAAHSRHPELHLSVKIPIMQAPEVEHDEIQSPCSDGKVLLLEDSSSIKHEGNLLLSIIDNEGLERDIVRLAEVIGNSERTLQLLYDRKAEADQYLTSMEHFVLENLDNSRKEVRKQIQSRRDTAAAVLCNISEKFPFQDPQEHFMRDIVGLVALLGTVHISKFSKILAEYLGEDKMVAVVCRSFATAGVLEKYEHNGEVDCKHALHAEAGALGKSINGRFLLICLENIRPYSGKFVGSDLQRKLSLPDPTLPEGDVPSGFLGYAVNMVNVDIDHLHTRTDAGYGLRETLFYHLFGELQVYDTREHMFSARNCIKHGAVSLDGGILRENGDISLGYGKPEICFPVAPENVIVSSPLNIQTREKAEALKSELSRIVEKISKETKAHAKSVKKFMKKKKRYIRFLDNVGQCCSQHESNANNNNEVSPC